MKLPHNIKLGPSDMPAILAALPLAFEFEAFTDQQQAVNTAVAASVAQKISLGNYAFTPDEHRIIGSSVYMAQQYLAGHMSDIFPDLDSEDIAELRKYFWTSSPGFHRYAYLFSGE